MLLDKILGNVLTGAIKGAISGVIPPRKQKQENKENETMKEIINAIIRWGLAIAGGGILGDTITQNDISQLQSAIQTIVGGLTIAIPIIWSIVEKIRAKKA